MFTGVTGGLGKPKTLISSSLGKPNNITANYTSLYICVFNSVPLHYDNKEENNQRSHQDQKEKW